MKINCPHCQHNYEVDDAYHGQSIECENCSNAFVAALSEEAIVTPAPVQPQKPVVEAAPVQPQKPVVEADPVFERPKPVRSFRALGILCIVLSVFAFLSIIFIDLTGVIWGFMLLIYAGIWFAIAQVAEAICLSAHNSTLTLKYIKNIAASLSDR